MASVVRVVLGRHVSCRRYATDGPGHLRFVQGFRARAKTFLAWTGPTAACYQRRPEATMSTNPHTLIIDMPVIVAILIFQPLVSKLWLPKDTDLF